MPLETAVVRSDQEYRRWITRFASRVLITAAGGVLVVSGALLPGEIDLRSLAVLAGAALLVGLLIRVVSWHTVAAAWFFIPTVLTGIIVFLLLRLSGGVASPFRLLPVAVLFFTIAYFEGFWLWIGTLSVMVCALAGLVGIEKHLAMPHRAVEALCLVLLAVIGARTIHILRKQRRKISQLNDRIHQQRSQLVEITKTQTMMELAGGVAHELNQPLTVLLAESERLQRYAQIPPGLRDALTACFTEAQRAAKIVQRFQQLTDYRATPYMGGVNISRVLANEPTGEPSPIKEQR